ncbi:MAG: YkgJ family cysteine cluster protein [Alphaproteobacteria bacterium]|nr:YkgJ family cysteine cluster protein [Alphaproteobacteria bacterium]
MSKIRLNNVFEQMLTPAIKDQLRAIGGRVYDVVAPAIDQARRESDVALQCEAFVDAHALAAAIFEAECSGYFHNVPGGLDLLKSLACKSGCAFCCELKVEVTAFEAAAIWAGLRSEQWARQREALAATGPRTAPLDTEARRRAHIPCALLTDGQCAVYEFRPYGCRGFFATDAADCERVLKTPPGMKLPPVRSPAVPRALASAFAAGANAALADKGLQHDFLELNSAIAALVSRPAAFGEWLAGGRVFTRAAAE